jgi:hypothetical protein
MRNNTKQRVVLCIMDGWGINKNSNHNAVALAKTPNVDYLTDTYPYSTLEASGEHVGLPTRSSRQFRSWSYELRFRPGCYPNSSSN